MTDASDPRQPRMNALKHQSPEDNKEDQATAVVPDLELPTIDASDDAAETAAALMQLSCCDREEGGEANTATRDDDEDSVGEELGSEDSDTASEDLSSDDDGSAGDPEQMDEADDAASHHVDDSDDAAEDHTKDGYIQLDEDEDCDSISLGSYDTDQEPMLPAGYGDAEDTDDADDADDEGDDSDPDGDNNLHRTPDASDADDEADNTPAVGVEGLSYVDGDDDGLQSYTHADGREEFWFPQPSGWTTLNREHGAAVVIEKNKSESEESEDEGANSGRAVPVVDDGEISIAYAITVNDAENNKAQSHGAECTCPPALHLQGKPPYFDISAGWWVNPRNPNRDTEWSTHLFTISPAQKKKQTATKSINPDPNPTDPFVPWAPPPPSSSSDPTRPRSNLSRQCTVPACDVHYPITGLRHDGTLFVRGSRFLKLRDPAGTTDAVTYVDQARSLRLIEHDDALQARRMNIHAPPADWADRHAIRKLNQWKAGFRRQRGLVVAAVAGGGQAKALAWSKEEVGVVVERMAEMMVRDGGVYSIKGVKEELEREFPDRARSVQAVGAMIRRYGLVGEARRRFEELRGAEAETEGEEEEDLEEGEVDRALFSPIRQSLRYKVEEENDDSGEGDESDDGGVPVGGGDGEEMEEESPSRKKARRMVGGSE